VECWTCKFWEESYTVRIKGEIKVIRGKCPFKKNVVNDSDKICKKYEKIKNKT
jgi:hypothetical protein